jgi:hypothetical protein
MAVSASPADPLAASSAGTVAPCSLSLWLRGLPVSARGREREQAAVVGRVQVSGPRIR